MINLLVQRQYDQIGDLQRLKIFQPRKLMSPAPTS